MRVDRIAWIGGSPLIINQERSTSIRLPLMQRSCGASGNAIELWAATVKVNQSQAVGNATLFGMESRISVPAVGLLETLSSPPRFMARSRIPVRPQCPSRPVSSTCGSIPHPLSRIRMVRLLSAYSISRSMRFAPE